MAGSSIPGRSVILSSHGDNQSLAASWGNRIRQSRPQMSTTFLVRPRSAASWVSWRAVASLDAPGCAFAWRQSTWTARVQLHPTVTSICWRPPWTFIRPPAKTLRGTWRANQRDMLTNKPCRTVRPPSNTMQCARWTWTVRQGSYAWNEQHEGWHAQNAASVEGLGNVRASGRCLSRGKARPPLALLGCGYYTGNVRPFVSRFFLLKYLRNDFGSVSLAHRCSPAFSWRQSTPTWQQV